MNEMVRAADVGVADAVPDGVAVMEGVVVPDAELEAVRVGVVVLVGVVDVDGNAEGDAEGDGGGTYVRDNESTMSRDGMVARDAETIPASVQVGTKVMRKTMVRSAMNRKLPSTGWTHWYVKFSSVNVCASLGTRENSANTVRTSLGLAE
jgi:hypothetical protein